MTKQKTSRLTKTSLRAIYTKTVDDPKFADDTLWDIGFQVQKLEMVEFSKTKITGNVVRINTDNEPRYAPLLDKTHISTLFVQLNIEALPKLEDFPVLVLDRAKIDLGQRSSTLRHMPVLRGGCYALDHENPYLAALQQKELERIREKKPPVKEQWLDRKSVWTWRITALDAKCNPPLSMSFESRQVKLTTYIPPDKIVKDKWELIPHVAMTNLLSSTFEGMDMRSADTVFGTPSNARKCMEAIRYIATTPSGENTPATPAEAAPTLATP